MKKINSLQLLFHFIATCLFVFSFNSFSFLYDKEYLEAIDEYGVKEILNDPEKYGQTVQNMVDFNLIISLSSITGIFIAFIISVLISIRKRWLIWNSIIVLVMNFLLNRFDIFDFLNPRFISPAQFIDSLFFKCLTNGVFFLIVGLVVFLSKRINNIIDKQMQKTYL